MNMRKEEQSVSLRLKMVVKAILFAVSISIIISIPVFAKTVSGTIYASDTKDGYTMATSRKTNEFATYGTLDVFAKGIKNSTNNGIQVFSVKEGLLEISYGPKKSVGERADGWTPVDDGDKKVGSIKLDDAIKSGALILQTSRDGKNWVTDYEDTDIVNKYISSDPFYETTDVQMVNGSYFRVIVAMEVQRDGEPWKILSAEIPRSEKKKITEVYTFYAYNEEAIKVQADENDKRHALGSTVRCAKYEGFEGSTPITNKDPHYGWEIGQFYVSGYTDKMVEPDGNVVFLKNVGDKASLWFTLKQDINCLNGNQKMKIMDDNMASDQYFQTPTMDFGHGALIIRKTNYMNEKETPQIYANYLEASASTKADTKVNLFEEGDYEVALDYGINKDLIKPGDISILPQQSHYRIFFRFSVRNANSMFYPRDIVTNSELANNSITKNGFYLDLANSKYLKLNVVREVLKEGSNSLSEADVRFNKSAKDGDKFKDEGVYTVTVWNDYTEQSTTKKLYVGDNSIIKAYMVTGLPINVIQEKVANGAKIDSVGNITEPIATTNGTDPNEATNENREQRDKNKNRK